MEIVIYLVCIIGVVAIIAKIVGWYKEELPNDRQETIKNVADKKNYGDVKELELNISCPHPASCSEKSFYKFIDNTYYQVLDAWYKQGGKDLEGIEKYKVAIFDKIMDESNFDINKYLQKPKSKIEKKDVKDEKEYYNIKVPDYFKKNSQLSFTAFDFETATTNRMACQLGIVVVENGEIVEEKCFTFAPPNNEYNSSCSRVHGMTAETTEGCQNFADVFPEIRKYLENKKVVAHNFSFDSDVLNKNIEAYSLPSIEFADFFCTCRPFKSINLQSACSYFGIPLSGHHNALTDAKACALLFLKYTECEGEDIEIPRLKKISRKVSLDNLSQDLSIVKNKDTIFYDKKIVITGTLDKYPSRDDLARLLKEYGADINTSISKKTNIVITGKGFGPSKMKKVDEINESGGSIIVMDEEKLIKELEKIV